MLTDNMELQNPKGTKDLDPEEKILMDNVISILSEVFELYGYNPIDFPILERYETLSAKFAAGEESDALKETFKLKDQGNRDLGLRFDLTVPFSRYIGMNPNIKMPFKKYVMGKVFRDGPIKLGRMREFFQIDPDVVGIKSVVADAEIISLSMMAFEKLGLDVYCEYNSRKLLDAIMDYSEIQIDLRFHVIIIVDKLKKVGEKEVIKELEALRLDGSQIKRLIECIKDEKFDLKIKKLGKLLLNKEGVEEIERLSDFLGSFNVKNAKFVPSLARGLAYYTGPVYEFYLKKSKITSSIAGGGRYDKMIGKFLGTDKEFPATGISFGVSVIIEALKEIKNDAKKSVVDIFIIPIKTLKESLKIANELRNQGIKTDIDMQERGPSKNLDYANLLGIPYVLFVGPKELELKKFKLRNMKSGEEKMIDLTDISKIIN